MYNEMAWGFVGYSRDVDLTSYEKVGQMPTTHLRCEIDSPERPGLFLSFFDLVVQYVQLTYTYDTVVPMSTVT